VCGIAGIVSVATGPRPRVDERALDEMTDSLVHRGPDGRAVWLSPDGTVGFGHRRLAIIDLSPRGAQPMANEDGTITVTFNGEIYNYLDLRRELAAKGHAFRSQSDTEVLVHLYEEEAEGMVERLDGDFAFAIWDERRKRLFMARDPLGVKPLHYAFAGPFFLFASEIKAILRHPLFRAEIDAESVYHYLTYLVAPGPTTMVKGVHKLLAGRTLDMDVSGRVQLRDYWEPLPGRSRVDHAHLDEQFADLFMKSVKKRLQADVPVGLLFSGGVDSSLNGAAFRSLVKPAPVSAYTVGMSGPRFADERAFAGTVAGRLGLRALDVEVREEDLLSAIETVVYHEDEPLADPVCVPLFFVTRLARRDGMVVLQAGEGADETFCGYDKMRQVLRHESRLWRPLSMLPRAVASAGYALTSGSQQPRWMKIADVLRRRSLGQEFFMAEAIAFYEHEKEPVISPAFRQRMRGVDSFDVVRPFYERLRAAVERPTFLETMTYIELRLRLPELLLMRADKIAMANSIELRVPFLDRELVEFALSVPRSYKLRDGVSKEPVKRLATRLTEAGTVAGRNGSPARDLFYRPKTGFAAPIQDWFGSALGARFRELLEADRHALAEYFNIGQVLADLDRGPATVNRAFQLWVLFTFAVWKKRFAL